jgi:hypothetical protein
VDVEGDTVVQEGFCRTCNKQWHEFYIRWSALEAVEEANPILSEEAKHFLTCASIAQEGQQWEDTGI